MRVQIPKATLDRKEDFIDGIGELIAPVVNMNGGVGMANISAVHISDTRHHRLRVTTRIGWRA
jgi:hypothetical protein